MRNSPFSRFQVRLRKVTWLLPLAAAASVAVLLAALPAAMTKYLPMAVFRAIPAVSALATVGWFLLTMLCSARIAVRITKTRKITQPVRVLATLLLGVILFFCYFFAGLFIMRNVFQ